MTIFDKYSSHGSIFYRAEIENCLSRNRWRLLKQRDKTAKNSNGEEGFGSLQPHRSLRICTLDYQVITSIPLPSLLSLHLCPQISIICLLNTGFLQRKLPVHGRPAMATGHRFLLLRGHGPEAPVRLVGQCLFD